jgi:hypothetical protein
MENKKFKSIHRAVRRGHLEWRINPVTHFYELWRKTRQGNFILTTIRGVV